MDSIAKLIQFGLGGHSIDYGRHHFLTGYCDPDNFWTREKDDIPDGTPVIDKRDILSEHPEFAIEFPMVDVDLPAGQVDRCPMPDPLLMLGLEGSYKTLTVRRKFEPGFVGLDSISLVDYINLWRKAGAKVGVVKNRTFIWEKEGGEK